MPNRAASKIKNLYKKHNARCKNRDGDPTFCSCPWYAAYKGRTKGLAAWTGKTVDPRSRKGAEAALRRFITAIDDRKYSPLGEQQSLGSGQHFSEFLDEWKTHYAKAYGLTSNSLNEMINVLKEGLGPFTLEELAGATVMIERWLNEIQKKRGWSNNTWNRYHELLNRICGRATKWRANGVPRMAINPMTSIERRVGSKKQFTARIEEPIEDKLLAACDQLNRPQHKPHSIKLDWKKVEEIRRRVEGGESQAAVARRFSISTGLCNQIIKKEIWNPEKYKKGTLGDLMRLRLMMALDTGARREEMMLVQLKHINFKPSIVTVDGDRREVLKIEVQSKGEKTTGTKEFVYAGTDRLKEALEHRRFELRNDPDTYAFGTADGRRQKSFRRLWRELFKLAGLDWGRDKGMVWHTLRHEFCSRTAENTGDPVVAQELARHKDLQTTQGYLHPRHARVLAAAVRLNRK